MTYRVGMAQILVAGGQPEANLERAISCIEEAAKCGCRLVLQRDFVIPAD
jgi:predicted amidohydrolase